jgi:hypothetical protein
MMKTIDCDEEERAGKTSKTQVSAMNNGDRSARTRPYDPLATQLVKKPPSEFRAYPLLVCGECDWIIGSESGRPLSPCWATLGGVVVLPRIATTWGSCQAHAAFQLVGHCFQGNQEPAPPAENFSSSQRPGAQGPSRTASLNTGCMTAQVTCFRSRWQLQKGVQTSSFWRVLMAYGGSSLLNFFDGDFCVTVMLAKSVRQTATLLCSDRFTTPGKWQQFNRIKGYDFPKQTRWSEPFRT